MLQVLPDNPIAPFVDMRPLPPGAFSDVQALTSTEGATYYWWAEHVGRWGYRALASHFPAHYQEGTRSLRARACFMPPATCSPCAAPAGCMP